MINDACRSERFKGFNMLERFGRDDGRKAKRFRKLEEWVVDVEGEFLSNK